MQRNRVSRLQISLNDTRPITLIWERKRHVLTIKLTLSCWHHAGLIATRDNLQLISKSKIENEFFTFTWTKIKMTRMTIIRALISTLRTKAFYRSSSWSL